MAARGGIHTELRENDDGPSVFSMDALLAPLRERKRAQDATRRLSALLGTYRGASETPGAWRGIYNELLLHYDVWVLGEARGDVGVHELALVPVAEHDATVNPGARLRRAVNHEAHTERLRKLYHDPAYLERVARGKKVALTALFGNILPAIECDSRTAAADGEDAARLDMYMTSVHLLWWTLAAAEALAGVSCDPGLSSDASGGSSAAEADAEVVPEAVHPHIEATLRGGTEVTRVQAQTLFVAMCAPFCTDPVQRRRTGEQVYDMWRTRFKDPAYTEQVNYCLRSCRGTEWLTEDEMDLEPDEDAFDADLDIRMPSEVEGNRPVDPLSDVIRRRTVAQRTLKAAAARNTCPPTPEMRAWCEDAWHLMAWGTVVDSQLNLPTTDSTALRTFQQCLVQPHALGSTAARNKYTGQRYCGVARLPTITIVSGGIYVFRCARCGLARRHSRAQGAVAAWFKCVHECFNGRDGFGTRIQ
jgi:hypothetical protein